ncbi:hypothetical protein CISG_04731 [Coccidioides immitis RMSCC 3703]|uniref:Uncharacterized protein n=2 Tax=Coccidioides immitis TaxID=5501 RepID=A0A0J8TNL4_COCIT|nr:hypothetical protein CIRG_09546 [Coccidioides immitis RMSCC 2394]KMU75312.1 hypothetical protein CISG_04731 [Coccidioides immitis RMSCC 3703]
MERAPANPMSDSPTCAECGKQGVVKLFALKDQPEKHRQSSKVPSVRDAPKKSVLLVQGAEPQGQNISSTSHEDQADHEIKRLNPSHHAGSQGNDIWKRDGIAQSWKPIWIIYDNPCLTHGNSTSTSSIAESQGIAESPRNGSRFNGGFDLAQGYSLHIGSKKEN